MAYDGVIEDVKRAIALEKPYRTPVFALSEEFDYDWAWVQADDCWEFEPLGVGCPGRGNILRATRDHIFNTGEMNPRQQMMSIPVYMQKCRTKSIN